MFQCRMRKEEERESLKVLTALTAYPLVQLPPEVDVDLDVDVDVDGDVGGMCCEGAGNPAYKRGRRFQLAQMIVLPFIPILALIVQTSLTLHTLLDYRNDIESVETQVTQNHYTCTS